MAAKINKTDSKFKIYREGEVDWIVSEKGYEQTIEDNGAELNLSYSKALSMFRLYFGYKGVSGNAFKRDIYINLEQVISLRNFLNEYIEKVAMKDKYFEFITYDSSILFNKIESIVPSVQVIGKKEIKRRKLVFYRNGEYGPTLANIEYSSNEEDVVWGVLYKIDLVEKKKIDSVMKGYFKSFNLNRFNTESDNGFGEHKNAYSLDDTTGLVKNKPYNWYKKLMVKGAEENGFPKDYIKKLKSIQSEEDKNLERKHSNLRFLEM